MKTVLLILLLVPTILWAQLIKITPEDTQRKHSYLIMRDGSVVRGQIVRQDSTVITVKKGNGDMTFVEADQLVRISPDRPGSGVQTERLSNESTSRTVFMFKDGTQLEGQYVRRDSTMITVRKRNGQLTYFEPELLARVDTVRAGMQSSASLTINDQAFTNRFSPWLLMGQTAHTAEKGRFYYRNTLALLNEFNYGITRHWSVGASFITSIPYLDYAEFFAFNDFLPQNSRLFSKLSVPIGDRLRLGLNVAYADKSSGSNFRRGPLTFQALTSIGTSQRNVTLGYGLISRSTQRFYQYDPYSSAIPHTIDVPTPNQSFLTLGIVQKVLPLLTLVSDNRVYLGQYNYNYYDQNSERASVSFAFRLDRQRHAFDIGFYGLVYRENYKWNDHLVRILPYLGYNLIIGRD